MSGRTSSAQDGVITLNALSKQYRGSKEFAIKDVALSVAAGEVYGFLGPNGAGKSTTIRCLLNFLQPSSGTATVLGKDSVKDSVAVKKHVGYLPGDVALYRRITGQEFLTFIATLQPPKHSGYVRVLTREFRAELNKPIEALSKGNRQKIGLIQALMHEPEVLILDEPTAGLDPLMQEVFFAHIARAKAHGASVFISSHNLPEVRRICDRIGFIRDGHLITEQTIADLAASASNTFDITFNKTAPITDLQRLKHSTITPSHNPRRVTVVVRGPLTPFLQALSKHTVVQLDQRDVDLEEEFRRLYDTKAKRS